MVSRTSAASAPDPLYSVGPYRRVVHASLERIWENVLDWEHLPHVHSDSFGGIRLVHAAADGWRAEITMVPSLGGTQSEVEVVLDRAGLRYVTRTLAGPGAGTEIVTTLTPVDARSTRISVEFLVPGVSEEHADLVGLYYRKLYARLWDQDEAMMVERERILDLATRSKLRVPDERRAPIPLGTEAELRPRLPLLVEVAERLFRIVDLNGCLVVHSAVCPHMGGPLDRAAVDGEACIACPWHAYGFNVKTGRSTDGHKLRLAPAPRIEVDPETGEVLLRWHL